LLCPPEHLYAGNDTETELQLHLEESYDAHAPHADETWPTCLQWLLRELVVLIMEQNHVQ
jgi:hypothetical protein